MSFWKKVENGLMITLDYFRDANEKRRRDIQRYVEMYEGYDDKKLYMRYRATHGTEQYVCMMLLKQRGYFSEYNE